MITNPSKFSIAVVATARFLCRGHVADRARKTHGTKSVPWLLLLPALCFAAGATDLRLVDAAKNKNVETVRTLIQQHSDANAAQPDGTTALAWAAHWDDLEAADLLIHAGAKPNLATEYGVTPLWLACKNGSAAMVEKLVKAGANPNAPLARTAATPLMMCARSGNADAVNTLLEHGGNANAKESWRGQTALMWAVEENHVEATRALLQHGADVHARSKSGFTPLMFAARLNNIELAKALLDAGAGVKEATQDDGPVLMVAAASGHQELAIFLLEKGADPNVSDGYGFTPLHYAAQKGLSNLSAVPYTASFAPPPDLPELAKALLAHGANPNARIRQDYPPHTRAPFRQTPPQRIAGATPFFLAAAAGDVNLMRILQAAGADPLIATNEGATPLMVAAGMNRVQDFLDGEEPDALAAVKQCLDLGASVSAADRRGLTALHAAAYTGANSIVEVLVSKGADLNAKDKDGQTPLSIAEAISPVVNNQGSLRVHKETAQLLLKLGAEPLPPSMTPPTDVALNPAK